MKSKAMHYEFQYIDRSAYLLTKSMSTSISNTCGLVSTTYSVQTGLELLHRLAIFTTISLVNYDNFIQSMRMTLRQFPVEELIVFNILSSWEELQQSMEYKKHQTTRSAFYFLANLAISYHEYVCADLLILCLIQQEDTTAYR